MGEVMERLEFKEKILPHLEALLQFALFLTKDGHDAVALMREAMAEAYASRDESIAEGHLKNWLNKILVSRFFNSCQNSYPFILVSGDNTGGGHARVNRFLDAVSTNNTKLSFAAGESDQELNRFKAISSLPVVCRPSMILLYLKELSKKWITDPAGAPLLEIEPILDRGRGFIQEELFSYLFGNSGHAMVMDKAEVSG